MKDSITSVKALIAIDTPVSLAIALLVSGGDFHPDHVAYLQVPLQQGIPDWLNRAIIFDRLDKVAFEHEKGIVGLTATPSEVLGFLYYYHNRKGELPNHWQELYFALLQVVCDRYKLNIPECLNIPKIPMESRCILFFELAQEVRQFMIEHSKSQVAVAA